MWSPLPHQRQSTTRIPVKLVRFLSPPSLVFVVRCVIYLIFVETQTCHESVRLAQIDPGNAFREMTAVDVVSKRLERTLCAVVL